MERLISLFDKITVNKVTYETSQNFATAFCELTVSNKKWNTSFIISHTDLNRIMAKLASKGLELDKDIMQSFLLEDGTEIIDCDFTVLNEGAPILEDFFFTDRITEIRA